MPDPFLFELMHRVEPLLVEKDHFNVAFEKAIKKVVDQRMEALGPSGFLSEEALRQKMEKEARESTDLSEFGGYVDAAVKIFRNEGLEYLGVDASQSILSALEEISNRLHAIDPEHINETTLSEALSCSDEVNSSIFKIGIEKYSQGLINDAIAIFTFLTLVASDEPDYWYRLGILLQQEGEFERALRVYKIASNIDPELIGPCLFAAECYLNLGEMEQAEESFALAKNIKETQEIQEEWQDLFAALEDLFASPQGEEDHHGKSH